MNAAPSDLPKPASLDTPTIPVNVRISYAKLRIGLVFALIGFVIFLLGARPSLFGMDRSPVIGFVQIAVFLVGLAVICLGGYLSLNTFWPRHERSIGADIGMRLVSTGYVVAVFAGMADIFGFGSHLQARLAYFGPWQARGVQIGEMIIAAGFFLMLPLFQKREN
jgi:hypothetical protein